MAGLAAHFGAVQPTPTDIFRAILLVRRPAVSVWMKVQFGLAFPSSEARPCVCCVQETHWALTHVAMESLLQFTRSATNPEIRAIVPKDVYDPGSIALCTWHLVLGTFQGKCCEKLLMCVREINHADVTLYLVLRSADADHGGDGSHFIGVLKQYMQRTYQGPQLQPPYNVDWTQFQHQATQYIATLQHALRNQPTQHPQQQQHDAAAICAAMERAWEVSLTMMQSTGICKSGQNLAFNNFPA